MFGKEKSREFSDTPIVSKSSSKDIKTLIGEGCKVEGNFFIPTYTRIDGAIKGDLTGDSGIVIGVNGNVDGNIVASEVINFGHIHGNIETQRLELKKGSTLEGDITVNQLNTEMGSSFNGKCSMSEFPKYVPEATEQQEQQEELQQETTD
jgi:cytoskeletal protein CcmA (bactofilin family)